MTERIGKYLRIEETANWGRKTRRWQVLDNHSGTLGEVEWFGRWRQYVFAPHGGTVYNNQCLQDIVAFLNSVNAEHRASA